MKTLFALVLIVMHCFGQTAPTGGSLLQDRFTKLLSFEDAHSGNVLKSWVSIPQSTVAADNRTVHSGKWAARIERTSASPLPLSRLLYTTILSFNARRIELRGWLRTENVNGFVGLWLRENGRTPNGQSKEFASEDMRGQRVQGTTKWKEYSISLPIDPSGQRETRVLYFGVVLSGTGKAWADDLQLLVDGKPLWTVAETTVATKPSLAAPVPKLRLEELTSLRSTTLHSRPPAYMGRIAILVDENSQSQSEYTAMAFRAVTGATVVGSTTAGADENISELQLPGGLCTMISGIGVFYPDKRPTQRIGIIPDVHASPTLDGILGRRDEVLEAAIRVILGDGVPALQVQKIAKPE